MELSLATNNLLRKGLIIRASWVVRYNRGLNFDD